MASEHLILAEFVWFGRTDKRPFVADCEAWKE